MGLWENLLFLNGEEVLLCCKEQAKCQVKALSVVLSEADIMPVHNQAVIPGMLSDDARGLQLVVSEPSHKQPLRLGILVVLIIVKIDIKPVQWEWWTSEALLDILSEKKSCRTWNQFRVLSCYWGAIKNLHVRSCTVPRLRERTNWRGVPTLEHQQRTSLKDLLHESQDIFSSGFCHYRRTELIYHRIKTDDHPAIRQPTVRLHLPSERGSTMYLVEKRFVEKPSIWLNKEEAERHRTVSGPWASPVVLIRQKDGSTHFH